VVMRGFRVDMVVATMKERLKKKIAEKAEHEEQAEKRRQREAGKRRIERIVRARGCWFPGDGGIGADGISRAHEFGGLWIDKEKR
jgi:hypothetical protein